MVGLRDRIDTYRESEAGMTTLAELASFRRRLDHYRSAARRAVASRAVDTDQRGVARFYGISAPTVSGYTRGRLPDIHTALTILGRECAE